MCASTPPFLDSAALPMGAELAGERALAQPCMTALGLTVELLSRPRSAPLTYLHEGLTIELFPDAQPAQERGVPDTLSGLIWGVEQDRGDRHVLHLYDGAQLPQLAGGDALPDLRVECLFEGAAAEDLSDVAPYLLELPLAHTHAANLFDDGGHIWSHWPKGAGVFLRISGRFDDVRKNLRRFTKLRDGTRWVFLRLAEPRMLFAILAGMSPGLRGRLFDGIDAIIAIDPEEQIALRATCTDQPDPGAPIHVEPLMKDILKAAVRARFAGDAERFCRETFIDRPVPADARCFAREAITTAYTHQIHDRQAVLLSVAAAWCGGTADWIGRQPDIVGNRSITQIERARSLLRRAHGQAAPKTDREHAHT